jgi:hypothetical protein
MIGHFFVVVFAITSSPSGSGNRPEHLSRQLDNGNWSSKLAADALISHGKSASGNPPWHDPRLIEGRICPDLSIATARFHAAMRDCASRRDPH